MYNALFQVLIFTGLLFMLTGWIMWKFPPKKVNGIYGYRTRASMKTTESWKYAQKIAAKEMIQAGLILVILSLPGIVLNISGEWGTGIGFGVMILLVIRMIYRVEHAIKKKYGSNEK